MWREDVKAEHCLCTNSLNIWGNNNKQLTNTPKYLCVRVYLHQLCTGSTLVYQDRPISPAHWNLCSPTSSKREKLV